MITIIKINLLNLKIYCQNGNEIGCWGLGPIPSPRFHLSLNYKNIKI